MSIIIFYSEEDNFSHSISISYSSDESYDKKLPGVFIVNLSSSASANALFNQFVVYF